MTYKNQFVVCIKCKGRVLREHGDVVYLPFGSEYSILLKNLNTVRAVVKVTIDGKDIGGELVLNPNSDLNLERFLEGDLNKGYRFKFIEKTQEISDHRGDRAEDGLIRVEYRFEKKVVQKHTIIRETHEHVVDHHHHHYHDHWTTVMPVYTNPPYTITCSNSAGASFGFSDSLGSAKGCTGDAELCSFDSDPPVSSVYACSIGPISPIQAPPQNDQGITVKGSDSHQGFHYVTVGELEDWCDAIVIHLKGTNNLENYSTPSEPITVATKLKCSSCGRSSDSTQKFCGNCGTRLV